MRFLVSHDVIQQTHRIVPTQQRKYIQPHQYASGQSKRRRIYKKSQPTPHITNSSSTPRPIEHKPRRTIIQPQPSRVPKMRKRIELRARRIHQLHAIMPAVRQTPDALAPVAALTRPRRIIASRQHHLVPEVR
jgi:hypothetical protein